MLLAEKTETGKRGKILIFAGSRRKAEETGLGIADSIPLLERHYTSAASNPRLRRVMEKGAAFVHAGLRQSDRKIAINAFDEGPLDVLVSTTSLAWGVNVAARTVIVRDIRVAMQKEIDFLDLKQMIGRAGRRGKESVAYAIILVPLKERQLVESALIDGKDIESKLERYLLDHINAEVNLGTIKDENSLKEWFSTTFWYYQNRQKRPDWEKYLAEQLKLLLKEGFIIRKQTRLSTTELGRLTSDWYVHVKTAINLLDGLRKFDFHTYGDCERAELSLLRLLATSEQDFTVVLRSVEEKEEVQKFVAANPMFADCELETAKAAMILLKAMKGYEFPEEEYQSVRLAIGLLGYISAVGALKENHSAYVMARDLARRLQYRQQRGSGQLLNLIWFSTRNNDEKERVVRTLFNSLSRFAVRSPRELKKALATRQLQSASIPSQLISNATTEFPSIPDPKLDGKHMGEDIKLIVSGLPEKVTMVCIPTGTGDDRRVTLRDSCYLSLLRMFPELTGTVGIKSFCVEMLAFNRLGWDYAKVSCELLVLPGSWRPSVLEELESFLVGTRPQVRLAGFIRSFVRKLKKIFSYTSYVNDFIADIPHLRNAAQILTRDSTTPIGKVMEIGYFAKKHIAIAEKSGEPDPAMNILRNKKATCLGFSVLVCSLMRSAGLRCNLVEVFGGRYSRHALPAYWEGARGYLLDVFDEIDLGLEVRSRAAKDLETIQFRISESRPAAEGRHLEWLQNYVGDPLSRHYDVKNFSADEYASLTYPPVPQKRVGIETGPSIPVGRKPSVESGARSGTSTRAEYPGWCPQCEARIEVGDEITWWNPDRETTRWVHVRCPRRRR